MRWTLLLVLLMPGAARAGLFDREDPDVTRGNEAYAHGDYQEALGAYESAATNRPDAVTDFDRGNALLKLGRLDEAQKAFGDSLAHGATEELASRAYANLGHALAEQNHVDEALKSYRRALEMNPGDEKARHDLGFLLAKKEEQKKQDQQKKDDQQKQDDQKKQDDQQKKDDSKSDEQKQGEQQKDQQKGEQKKDEQGKQDPQKKGDQQDAQGQPKQDGKEQQQKQQEQQAEKPSGEKQDPAQATAAAHPMPRSEAERLLDSLRDGEKSFQLWRHQKKARHSDADKNW